MNENWYIFNVLDVCPLRVAGFEPSSTDQILSCISEDADKRTTPDGKNLHDVISL